MIAYAALKEIVFSLFYVVNEENSRDSGGKWTFRLWIVIYIVDLLYGWSWAVVNVAKSLNIIELIISLGSTIPYVVFYVLAQILVVVSVVDAFYITNTYQKGTLKHRWPTKILCTLNAGLVNTFLASCLSWILYPGDCGMGNEYAFSSMIHGDMRDCDPWGVPEFGLTLLSIVMAIVFILFSIVTSFLCFEINPLAQGVRAACTGRIELMWTLLRVLCIILGLLTTYFAASICATIILVLAVALLQQHLAVMPFHNLIENIVRGGVYTSVAWAALTSILISAVADPASPPSNAVFALEWICVAVVPAIFFVGASLVYFRHKNLSEKIQMLRREWEISPEYKARAERRRRRSAASTSAENQASIDSNNYAKNSIFDRFFDLEFEANRAFDSDQHAHLMARTILLEKKKTDISFLAYVLKRGLQEFPESRDLIILNLLLMRIFVRAQAIYQTSAHERLIETLSDRTRLDHDYILFATQRGSGQPDGSGAAGKDDVNAFQIMEFEMKFDKVQKAHHECILALKTFWQLFYKHKKIFRSKKKYSEHLAEKVDELLACMEIIETCKTAAHDGYRGLLEKFPRSVSLLRSFAGFCDVVLNRAAEANQYRDQALLLETTDESEPSLDDQPQQSDGNDDEGGPAGVAKSTASSSEGTGRARMDRFFSSWKESVMSREMGDLKKLHWRIFYATLLIVIVCTVGFVFTDSVLYEQSARACINLVIGAQVFRVELLDVLFSVRSLFLAGYLDPPSFSTYQSRLDSIARLVSSAHVKNFEDAPDPVVTYYNDPIWPVWIPSGSGWTQTTSSLWSVGNELASQIGLVSGIKASEVKNWTNKLEGVSPALRAVAYLNENSLPNVVPAFEEVMYIQASKMGIRIAHVVFTTAEIFN